jgi:hypothetical protein
MRREKSPTLVLAFTVLATLATAVVGQPGHVGSSEASAPAVTRAKTSQPSTECVVTRPNGSIPSRYDPKLKVRSAPNYLQATEKCLFP